MANCKECGSKISWLYGGGDICYSCHNKDFTLKVAKEAQASQQQDSDNVQRQEAIEAILVTTAHTLQGIEVTKYLGFVSTECAYGMNMFKDMFANVRNLVGGRSAAVEDTMRDSRETVLLELKREAYAKGANAVIAVDLDYTQLGAGGNMMVLVTASGTAVVIEADEGV